MAMSKGSYQNVLLLEKFANVEGSNRFPYSGNRMGIALVNREIVTEIRVHDAWVCLELFVGQKRYSFTRDNLSNPIANLKDFPAVQSEEGPLVEIRFLSDESNEVLRDVASSFYD
jgi:hypothetical protein